MKFFRLLILFCIILIFNVQNIFAEDIEIDLDAGQQIFSQNCTACHAGGQNLVVTDKTLEIKALHKYSMDSIGAITKQVTNGNVAGMPAFGGRLSEEDIQNVAHYVLNQAKIGW
uniref:Cytochrome c-553 n=1 Tax=Acrosorium ciliolatum TaxID=1550622 RepID=A0A1Z1M1G0_9FLOR|nr:cytochrome c553 [Acrosorium ciliolatum]ARW59909.1 cytochrome c553 [Acrosorium ciliolatum]